MSLFPPELAWAHPVTAEWFVTKFGTPTEPQIEGWPSILAGEPTLISAPTGSGKTLAAFLVCIDKLLRESIDGSLAAATQIVYVSPLKALSNDIQKNLEGPLAGLKKLAFEGGYLSMGIRTGVRTGDTLPYERAAMLRNPPHILVTTPESLYILLTARNSREQLRSVRTVIVDEIHAIADDKRGAHLALTLERLEALVCGENKLSHGTFLSGLMSPPQRIGLSATQNPIELVASYLTGVHPARRPARIIQVGQRRHMDIAIEVPSDELNSVTSNAMWDEIFDKLAAHTETHRSTLVFVNTRKLVERVSFALAERLGTENVGAHHGSLARALRLDAERRLKRGDIKILVATASLELGIDIGHVDLVCQIASTRSIAVATQRVGRAGHWRGAIPKGRLFATTRDDLLEQGALVRKMRAGELDRLEIPPQPIDVLMQQIVACVAAEPWGEDALFAVLRRAYPYRNLTRALFDEIVTLLSEGIESSRGRYGAYLLRDRVHGQLHPRRGSRSIAISNGGAIPDTALFNVILQPEGVQIATLDEHFAVESSPGDVVLLGNTSWRIQRIEAAGRVLVEDAHGAPPTLPFWFGEAPQRTAVLSDGVGELREQISAFTPSVSPADVRPSHPEVAACIAWLMEECGLCASAARQLIAFIVAGRAVLGAVPSGTTIIAERFFDEGGGMQLIIHAPFGGRINKAWGLALRKRFCRGFNFELQAAATDNGLNIALAEQHSFPLADVFQFLHSESMPPILEQAALASPIFQTRWRWDATRALALLRFQGGKKVPPQIQRMRADDLLASVFPDVAACQENIEGDIKIPDHPLVREVMKDVLTEALDIEGLAEVLRGIEQGRIRCIAVDTPVPSQFSHEILNANPYAYLDDAPLEERRARAVEMRRVLPASVLEEVGALDPAAIAQVQQEAWPDVRDADELHDMLHTLVMVPGNSSQFSVLSSQETKPKLTANWSELFDRLRLENRAVAAETAGKCYWVAAERVEWFQAMHPVETRLAPSPAANQMTADANRDAASRVYTVRFDDAMLTAVQGWIAHLGPTTASEIGDLLGLPASEIEKALLRIEASGAILRGKFRPTDSGRVDLRAGDGRTALDRRAEGGFPHVEPSAEAETEWCERRLLARIHRLTVATLRKQIAPVTASQFMSWVLRWQHVAPGTQVRGEHGALEVLRQLQGFEIPASAWERFILARRISDYDPANLDQLCLAGAVGWGRLSPHPATLETSGTDENGNENRRRVIPTRVAPIAFFVREDADWMRPHHPGAEDSSTSFLSPVAQALLELLKQRGALFFPDMVRATGRLKAEIETGLWELVAAGLVTADGFENLRALVTPKHASGSGPGKAIGKIRRPRHAPGRWSLLHAEGADRDRSVESCCWMLLRRYGVVFQIGR